MIRGRRQRTRYLPLCVAHILTVEGMGDDICLLKVKASAKGTLQSERIERKEEDQNCRSKRSSTGTKTIRLLSLNVILYSSRGKDRE